MTTLDELLARDRNTLKVHIGINASIQEIAALGPERAAAFMTGLAKVIAARQLGESYRPRPA